MELPRSVPTDAFFLEMGIWPIRFEIELRQLTYLKHIIDMQGSKRSCLSTISRNAEV